MPHAAARALPSLAVEATRELDPDQRVFLYGATWADYERLLAVRGEKAVPRLTYLAGVLELMSPSISHEDIKKLVARLLEAYADHLELDLNGFGSWTLKRKKDERGCEPDECYTLGPPGRVPDLAIEVVWTSGGIDKLDIYRKLGVREVWIWQDGRLDPYLLRGERYVRASKSKLLPQVDLALLASFVPAPSQAKAVRALRARLSGRAR
jgi:Uma2 family endonuclease